jgi:hypothetical protein
LKNPLDEKSHNGTPPPVYADDFERDGDEVPNQKKYTSPRNEEGGILLNRKRSKIHLKNGKTPDINDINE